MPLLTVRLTEGEYTALKDRAKRENRTISAIVRRAVLTSTAPSIPEEPEIKTRQRIPVTRTEPVCTQSLLTGAPVQLWDENGLTPAGAQQRAWAQMLLKEMDQSGDPTAPIFLAGQPFADRTVSRVEVLAMLAATTKNPPPGTAS